MVLLILAGVSIAFLTGDNGIITQAQNASDETQQASLQEEVDLKLAEKNMGTYTGDKDTLEKYLNEIEGGQQ